MFFDAESLEAENSKLRKQVIKGRVRGFLRCCVIFFFFKKKKKKKNQDMVKLLAEKYASKLAALQEQHRSELEARGGGEELRALRAALDLFVSNAHAREQELNCQLKSMTRLVRRQAQYIQVLVLACFFCSTKLKKQNQNKFMEEEEEELAARLAIVEGKVRRVCCLLNCVLTLPFCCRCMVLCVKRLVGMSVSANCWTS
jgi:hypothetical protein